MKKIIDVLVVEDNEYYNNLLSRVLQQSPRFNEPNRKYKLVLHSFMDSATCIHKINSEELRNDDIIAFVDYYLGNNISGSYIINLLRKKTNNSLLVLLSQSGISEEKGKTSPYDFFVKKDQFAPAICRLYFEQFIDNNYL